MIGERASDYKWFYCLQVGYVNGHYSLALCGYDDNGEWIEGQPVVIQNSWQAIELEWQASSAPGANDGLMKLWINDGLMDTLQNLDNDSGSIALTYLGVDSDLDAGTSGTIYFDSYALSGMLG